MTWWQALICVVVSLVGTVFGWRSGKKSYLQSINQKSVDELAFNFLKDKLHKEE